MPATVRMKRLIAALVPWMVLGAASQAQTRAAELAVGCLPPIKEHVWRVGSECYVPTSALRTMGWSCTEQEGIASIKVDGRQARLAMRKIGNDESVPLNQLLDAFGMDGSWEAGTNRFFVPALLKSVKYKGGQIAVDATLPVRVQVFNQSNPDRTFVDLVGAKLTPDTDLGLEGRTLITPVRGAVRLSLDQPLIDPAVPASFRPNRAFSLELGALTTARPPVREQREPAPTPRLTLDPGMDEDPGEIGASPAAAQTAPAFGSVQVGPLQLQDEGPAFTRLVLKTSRPLATAPRFRRPEPDTVELVFPAADLKLEDGQAYGKSIDGVSTRIEAGSAVLTLKLSRPMGIELTQTQNSVLIQLIKPNVGNGKLAGKVIVIDAGHGGEDSGARSPDGGVWEKNLTLAIAKITSDRLTSEGATVIMTRKTDVLIPLSERPQIANRNRADFFISIHINSASLASNARGTITFHHKGNSVSQLLGECLLSEIKKTSGLPGIGTWSDGRIYENGFAVLRGATMPAVLIECGFITNGADVKRMITDDFQWEISTAIVRGLKVYLGEK